MAARAWAFSMRGQCDPKLAIQIDEDTKTQFASLGVNVELTSNQDNEVFEVRQDNWKALSAFLALETQWRVASSMAGIVFLGLDYTSAAALFKGKSVKKFQKLMADISILEAVALPILNAESN